MPVQESPSMRELKAFVDRCHAAITKQSQGHPEPFLELWSHADDVTIMAAIGGYQVGFDAVRELLTAASKTQQFDGWRAENVATVLDENLAFTVELEHYAHTDDREDKGMTLRATQIYRRGRRAVAGHPPPWRHPDTDRGEMVSSVSGSTCASHEPPLIVVVHCKQGLDCCQDRA